MPFRFLVTGSVALALVVSTGCSRTRTVDHEMTWSQRGDPDEVYLDFSEQPNHFVSIRDERLSDYLDTLSRESVTVRFEVTTRLGCVERLRATRIDGRDDWVREWGGSGWVGSRRPSPWDRHFCLIPWWRQ